MLRIRVDDFPGTKPEEFDRHNLENYEKFHRVLGSRGIPYVLGVIPKHSTAEQLKWLGCAGMEIALHGITHDERYPNEFREYQTRGDVAALLEFGRMHLGLYTGHNVTTYIPPHNVVDRKTVDALVDTGFKRLMGGPGTPDEIPVYALVRGLEVVMSQPPLEYGRSDELIQRGSVEHLRRRLSEEGDVWLTLHWTWEYNIGLQNLERFVDLLCL